MRLHTVRETYSPGDVFTLYPLGDIHLGSANCDRGLLRETIREIADDPLARWGFMGDGFEWIGPKDPRWDAAAIDEEVIPTGGKGKLGDICVEYMAETFEPIIHKCWWWGDGNHENSFNSHCETNVSERILKSLGRLDLYTGWSAITRAEFSDDHGHRNGWRIYHQHGWQAGRRDGAKVNQAAALIAYIDADVYLQGHSHSRFVVAQARLSTDHGFTKLVAQDVYVGHTGSFLRTYQQDATGYAERKGYPPTSLGPIKLRFRPGRDGRKRLEAVQ